MNIVELQDLTLEELQKLQTTIQQIITEKKASDEKVVWSHRCSGSSKHHIGKYKHYAKSVTAVNLDTEKINGYAIIGDFLPSPVPYDENEVRIPANTLVLEVCSSSKTEIYRASDPSNILHSYSGRVSYEDLEKINNLL